MDFFPPSFVSPTIFLKWVWMSLNFPMRIKFQMKIQNADLPLAIFSSLFVAAAICWSVHQGGLWSENPPAHLADVGHVLIHIISVQLTMTMDTIVHQMVIFFARARFLNYLNFSRKKCIKRGVIKIFGSIELNNLWSKKIFRPKMIVWSRATFILGWSCFVKSCNI